MSFKLKDATFRVRCREPGCPFNSEFTVKENIMGATEADVDSEAIKLARNLGYIKHDAIYGRKHQLANPEVTKVSGSYDRIGAAPDGSGHGVSSSAHAAPSTASAYPTRTYQKGQTIIRKGESAATVVEVVRGNAYNIRHPDMSYGPGTTFGAAALFRQKSRLADIVAGEDGTTVTFFNIRELTRSNPAKARELYDEAMEDVFHILVYLEEYSTSLEKKVQRLERKGSKALPAAKKGPAKKPARKVPAKKGKKAVPAKKKPKKASR
jgi:hypothetical protein